MYSGNRSADDFEKALRNGTVHTSPRVFRLFIFDSAVNAGLPDDAPSSLSLRLAFPKDICNIQMTSSATALDFRIIERPWGD